MVGLVTVGDLEALAVDLRDVRVVEAGQDLRLALESGQARGVTAV